jgi:Nucleotidyl transferase AbiEii toxin, Type IV TA system
VPSDFVLYGGTGLALQLGHRVSEDFDFFSSSGFDPDRLQSRLPFFRDLDTTDPDTWVHHKRDNLEAFVNRGGLVKVAFFGGLDNLQRIQDPQQAAGSRVRVASLVDLAGMKMRVIQVREIGRTTWTFTLWCRMGSICRQHWRQPKRSTKASIRRPAFAPYSFMATGHWIGSRRLCGGI